jgi:signal transduction histidine kinase
VTVYDDGVGMGVADLPEAKKFGLSPKSITQRAASADGSCGDEVASDIGDVVA